MTEREIEMRANFNQKFAEALNMPKKSRKEYVDEARHEINEQNARIVEFMQSVKVANQ